jgi:hypothetical protein
MADQNTTKQTASQDVKNPNLVVQELNVALPYIGDTIYTNVLAALADHDTEKEFNDNFKKQHERNVQAVREEQKGEPEPVYRREPASEFGMAMLLSTMMQPMAQNSFMAKLLEPAPTLPIDPPQQSTNAIQQASFGPQIGETSTQHKSVVESVPPVPTMFIGDSQQQHIHSATASIEDPREYYDRMLAGTNRRRTEEMRIANRLAAMLGLDASTRQKPASERTEQPVARVKSVADQTLETELRNEQFRGIEFENRVRRPKDELLYKFLKDWDDGKLDLGKKTGEEAEQPKNGGFGWGSALLLGGGLALLNHALLGKFGDAVSVLEGKGLKAGGNALQMLNPEYAKNAKQATAERARIRATNAQAKVDNYKGSNLKKSNALVDKARKASGIADEAEKAAADAAKRAASQSGRIAKLTTGPLAKTGAAVAKVGKVLGPLGVAVGAGASGLEALNRYQSGDTRGAKNTLIGGGVDAALGATSLAAGPVGWGALAGQLAFGGTTFIGKKMGFIDEGSPDSIGEAISGYLDYRDGLADQKENTAKMLDSSIHRRLQSQAKQIAKQRPDIGDSNIVLDKFLSTDRAKDAIGRIKEASDNYADANSLGGQLKFWGDSSEEAYKKLEDAQDDVLKLMAEFASTYDPNKMHDWVFETQARIQAEQETAQIEAAATAGKVEGSEDIIEKDHEYNAPFDASLMQQSVFGGMTASLMDPRYHEMMRQDMSVIGRQLNTQMTGM